MAEQKTFQFLPGELDALTHARVIYVATVRRDATQSRASPMWFTITGTREVLVQSRPDGWQTKRIRRGSPVLFWIGTRRGRALVGRAEVTGDPAVLEQIIKDYPRKYWLARLGIHRPTKSSFERGDRLAIRIIPIDRLPQGFNSQPGVAAPKPYVSVKLG